MSENQIELNNARKNHLGRFVELLPDLSKGLMAVAGEAYKDGVIDSKTKRLMAMAVALGLGCKYCILGQTEEALDLGATKEEILETIAVVASVRGTSGIAESYRLIQFLDELGKL